MKYRLYGAVTATKYLGEIEADSEEEAIKKGFELDSCSCSVCHQCSNEVDDPQIEDITAELIED
jgi:hypothetical protein